MSERRDPLMGFNFTVSLLPSPDRGNGPAGRNDGAHHLGIRARAPASAKRAGSKCGCRWRTARPAASMARC
jgi:hypothetical protein